MTLDLNPDVGPLGQFLDRAAKLVSLFREMILNPHRGFRMDGSLNHALGLQFLETLGQEPITQARDGVDNVGKPGCTLEQGAQDRAGPPAADEFYGPVEFGAHGNIGWGYPCLHCSLSTWVNSIRRVVRAPSHTV